MKVMILGSGGREHALGWKLAQSPQLEQLYFVPGNPGTRDYGTNLDLKASNEIVDFCVTEKVDLVVPGPEAWLMKGIVDDLKKAGVRTFGPTRAAAMLEGSKAFAKRLMEKASVPTAAYAEFKDAKAAIQYLKTTSFPCVVKADGLAAGKGVTICTNLEEAEQAIQQTMVERKFGDAGDSVVIEEFLTGTEASFHLLCDGKRAISLVSAQDHKALYDGNMGPNTGGMGTFAPSPLVTPQMEATIRQDIAEPVLKAMAEEGTPFIGSLFIGLMLTYHGPRVLEFNCRFGDPETQVMMPLLDEDLLPILMAAADGNLPDQPQTKTKDGHAVCVILASKGYPEAPEKGKEIRFPKTMPSDDLIVFHAGTREDSEGRILTAGGRVLGITAQAPTMEKTREHVYEAIKKIHFDGMYYRNDIGGLK